MNYEQTTIFDLLCKNAKEEIMDNLKKYEIDNLYKKKLKEGSYTFLEIYRELSKSSVFDEYLKSLAIELKKHIKESENCHQDFIDRKLDNSFTERDDCIMIYNVNDKSVGPIYCAEMIKNSLFEECQDDR